MRFNSRAGLVFLIFLNGYISLSLELVVLRQLSFFVGSSAVITSIIMGIFLGFMSLGYFLGASKRVKDAHIPTILGISFIIIAFLACGAGTFTLISRYFGWTRTEFKLAHYRRFCIQGYCCLSVRSCSGLIPCYCRVNCISLIQITQVT